MINYVNFCRYTQYGDVRAVTTSVDGKLFTTTTSYSPTRKPTQITNPDNSQIINVYSTTNPQTPLISTYAKNSQGNEVARVSLQNYNEYNKPRNIVGGNINKNILLNISELIVLKSSEN